MQIISIQSAIKNNFQYKNNLLKTSSILFQGKDTFERKTSDDIVASKKYYRFGQEIDPNMLIKQGQRLFILQKDSYIPYGAISKEYNANNEMIRCTSYSNGAKHIVDSYKNGQIIQQDKYEDIFGSIKNSSKRTAVLKFDDSNKTKPRQTFGISRNYGKNWKSHPIITLRKIGKNNALFVGFSAPSETTKGKIEITYTTKNINHCFYTLICDEKDYFFKTSTTKSENETALLALIELKETIQSDEFCAEFGDNEIFNSELDKAIEFLSSKLNAD